jgi:hypothetical protein
MNDPSAFAKLVPGFDFLQGLVKNAGAALPGIGSWVAPTIDPAELDKRIDELRTVQFWLEQNARMLGATIQALEVQRMTLSTLKTMNVQMEDLRDSLQIRMPTMPAPAPKERPPAPETRSAPAAAANGDDDADDEAEDDPDEAPAEARSAAKSKARPAAKTAAPKPAGPGVVDPLQWWGALTKQFTELAANAMKETAGDAARSLAGNVMKQSINAATESLQKSRPDPKAAPAKKKAPARKRAAAKR